jgi:hypothetical protein
LFAGIHFFRRGLWLVNEKVLKFFKLSLGVCAGVMVLVIIAQVMVAKGGFDVCSPHGLSFCSCLWG